MHSIDVGHAAPRAPWGGVAPQGTGRSWFVPDAANSRQYGDRAGTSTPSRGTDFVRQMLHAQVLTSLRADYRISPAVPMQGLGPDESATQGLAGAASQALAPGGKGADALRESVDAGLADAASLLQALGINADDLAALAEDLRSRLESFIGAARSVRAGATARESVVAAGASFTQKQKTQVEIVTQEGDTVRLSLRSRVTVAAGGVASSAADGSASSAAVSVITGGKFEISVDGNLNDEEAAAIRDVLAKVEALAEDFFAGDVQAAFAAAANLDIDGDQLASVALDLTLKQRVRAVGFASLPVASPPAAPTAGATPPAVPATPAPVVDTSPSALLPDSPAEAAAGGDQPADADPTLANPPQTDPTASPDTTITGYLVQLLDSLRDAGNTGYASVSWKFKLELLLAVTSAKVDAEPRQASQPAMNKLGETLGALV